MINIHVFLDVLLREHAVPRDLDEIAEQLELGSVTVTSFGLGESLIQRWRYALPKSVDFDGSSVVNSLLEELCPHAHTSSRIATLPECKEIRIGCAVYTDGERPILALSPDQVGMITSMAAGFDVDLYMLPIVRGSA